MNKPTIVCIYCKRTRQPTKEHVLPYGLGGNLTKPLVCDACRFSHLDQALMEQSPVALNRVAYTPTSAFGVRMGGQHFHYDTDTGDHLDVVVENGPSVRILPQIILPRDGEPRIVGSNTDALTKLMSYIEGRLETRTLRDIHVRVGPINRCKYARLVKHRSKDAYLRVPRVGEELRVFETLESNWQAIASRVSGLASGAEVPETKTTETPTVEMTLTFCPNDYHRGVAKIAFNFAATLLGAELVLAPEFDSVREYIKGTEVQQPAELADGQVSVDPRFVTMLEADATPLVPTDDHVVTICYVNGELFAWVTLYKNCHFVVRLGQILLNEPVLGCREFSRVRTDSRALSAYELAERVASRPRST